MIVYGWSERYSCLGIRLRDFFFSLETLACSAQFGEFLCCGLTWQGGMEKMNTYSFQGLCTGDDGIECGLGEINDLGMAEREERGGQRVTDCFSGSFLEVPEPFPFLLPVALLVSGRSSVWGPGRFR